MMKGSAVPEGPRCLNKVVTPYGNELSCDREKGHKCEHSALVAPGVFSWRN